MLKCIDVPVPVFISQESPVCADAACEMETADVGTVWCLYSKSALERAAKSKRQDVVFC